MINRGPKWAIAHDRASKTIVQIGRHQVTVAIWSKTGKGCRESVQLRLRWALQKGWKETLRSDEHTPINAILCVKMHSARTHVANFGSIRFAERMLDTEIPVHGVWILDLVRNPVRGQLTCFGLAQSNDARASTRKPL